MKLSIVIGFTFFCLLCTQHTCAQQTQVMRDNKVLLQKASSPADTIHADTLRSDFINGFTKIDQIEIDRLIIDETISKAGYDFFELFNSYWTWPEPSKESFILVIAERPYRGISTQVIISVNELIVFESFLQTRYDFLEYLAGLAAEQTIGYIINYEDIIKQLEGADAQGNGIF